MANTFTNNERGSAVNIAISWKNVLRAVLLAGLCGTAAAQIPERSSGAVKTAETYLKKVLAANSANAPVPVPSAAERAALESLKARVNSNDELEQENWPATPLNKLKSVGQLNGLVGQLSNTGIYRTKAEQNAREAERRGQLDAIKERSEELKETGALGKLPRVQPSQKAMDTMKSLGVTLDDKNQIVAGGKTFDPTKVEAAELAAATAKPRAGFAGLFGKGGDDIDKKLANPNLKDAERTKLEEAKRARDETLASIEDLLSEIRAKLLVLYKAQQPAPVKR